MLKKDQLILHKMVYLKYQVVLFVGCVLLASAAHAKVYCGRNFVAAVVNACGGAPKNSKRDGEWGQMSIKVKCKLLAMAAL